MTFNETNFYFEIGFGFIFPNHGRDRDYLLINKDEENRIYKRYIQEGNDILEESLKELKDRISFDKNWLMRQRLLDHYQALFLYQLDTEFRKQRGSYFPLEINILQHKEDILNLLREIEQKKKFNFNRKITIDGKYVSKTFYSIAINKFFIANNSMILTKEQKNIILKIHDIKMTWEEYIEKVGFTK